VDVEKEFAGAVLGHARTEKRLTLLAGQIATSPGESFPRLARSDSELESMYRFFGNDRFEAEDLLQPHIEATANRAGALSRVLVLHDTSEFEFSGKRKGLGPLKDNRHRGFLGHFALAATWERKPKPLGVLGFTAIVRNEQAPAPHWSTLSKAERQERKKQKRRESSQRMRTVPRAQKESCRWENLAIVADSRIQKHTEVVHVMDQESDDYALWSALVDAGKRFVSRARADRLVKLDGTLQTCLDRQEATFVREIKLSRRPFKNKTDSRKHPPRDARLATLFLRAAHVEIPRPPRTQSTSPSLTLNVVQVFEPEPPEGAEPISWTLVTTEPIGTLPEMTDIVDAYCGRWLIEEFFKAIKTGCAYEKRQLESIDALLKALMIFIPIAWHLLALRTLARASADVPASCLFSDAQLLLLQSASTRVALKPGASVQQVMLAIAGLGGHIKNNGPPGWLILARGYRELLTLEHGLRIAQDLLAAGKSIDQL